MGWRVEDWVGVEGGGLGWGGGWRVGLGGMEGDQQGGSLVECSLRKFKLAEAISATCNLTHFQTRKIITAE